MRTEETSPYKVDVADHKANNYLYLHNNISIHLELALNIGIKMPHN